MSRRYCAGCVRLLLRSRRGDDDGTPNGVRHMRNRTLTGHWAGFSFQNGYLVTPEGRGMEPGQLSYLGLTCTIAREWSTMMSEERAARGLELKKAGNRCGAKVSKSDSQICDVIYLRDVLRQRREQRSSVGG
ncbi:phage protein, partial [Xanthomonas hortorum pv. gardneri]